MSTTNPQHDEQLDAVLADYLARIDRGEAVDNAQFCAAHPELAGELREFLEMANLLEYLGNGSVAQGEKAGFPSTADALSGQPTLAEVGCRPPVCGPLTAAAKESPQGVQFGRYFLQEILGEGSMGTVHLAWDTEMDRFVALKVPRIQETSSAAIERFRREARASVQHPNICPIFDVGTIDGVHYLSMAYINGESLARPLERGEIFPVPRVLQLVRTLAEALQTAHSRDVVHRDLKPANIMLDLRGEPIITDFGLARRLDMRETLLTQSGMLVGTLAYMSPEQLEGNPELIGRATDIYSLGVIFYQLLCGRLPYSGGFLSVILQIRAGQPQPPTELRPDLRDIPGVEEVCLKMMALDPSQRYGSMADVAAAIGRLLGEPIPPPLAECEEPPCVEIPCAEPPRVLQGPAAVWPLLIFRFPITLQHGAASALGALALVLAISILVVLLNGNPTPEVSTAGADEKQKVAAAAPAPETKLVPPIDIASGGRLAGKPVVEEPAAPVAPRPAPKVVEEVPTPKVAVVPIVAEKIHGMLVTSRRAAAKQFGVVDVDISLPTGNELEYRRDWQCRISSLDQRVLYPAYQLELVGEDATKTHLSSPRGKIRRLRTSFLTFGEQPLRIELCYGGRVLLAGHDIPANVLEVDRDGLLNDWWARYTLPPRESFNEEAREIKSYLHDMLARRMNLPVAQPLPFVDDDASALQRYFEKSVGTFLGFASVRTALGEENYLAHAAAEPLDQLLPQPTQIPPVQYPAAAKQVAIETIASHVPDDCVYLRCQSLENYVWFRELLQGWGGGLDEIVSPMRIERPVRERLERQLALSTDADAQQKLKNCLTDLAVIFGDTCFVDGASVGVLFQVKNEADFKKYLQEQRDRVLREMAADKPTEVLAHIGGVEVSQIYTSDNRLRSYHAVSGRFHLITNSDYLVRRFFEAGQGKNNLAKLKEFQYARTKVRLQAAQDVFLYMPDPFFQRTISPEFQIELGRRRQANADLQHLELARLAAKGEGFVAPDVSELIQKGFLPTNFSDRSDGSHAMLRSQRAEDSERGAPGTFLPVCDIHVTKATMSEVRAYREFSDRYRAQYRKIDPVAVVVSHQKLASGREDVKVEIAITPFALGAYASLQRVLDDPQKRQIVGPPDELISLRGSLRTHGNSFLALASIHDQNLEFRLVDGQVQIQGLPPGATFAGNNWLLALDRRDPECLRAVAELAGYSGVSSSLLNSANTVGTVLIGSYVDILGRLVGLQPMPRQTVPAIQPRGEGWQLLSPRDELSREADFKWVKTADSKQIRFEMKALQGKKIEPYIQAYTYLEARRASAKQAALLELTMQQLRVPPAEVRLALEQIHAARFHCPLQGRLEFTVPETDLGRLHGNHWCSDRWTNSSLYDETTVPEDYRFAFTDWLRGMNVGFSLEGQTLSAELRLEILPRHEADRATAEPKRPALQK